MIDVNSLRNPLQYAGTNLTTWSQQQLGVATGWSVAVLVYLALAYLTFFYRWPKTTVADPLQRTH